MVKYILLFTLASGLQAFSPAAAQKGKKSSGPEVVTAEPQFIDDIEINLDPSQVSTPRKKENRHSSLTAPFAGNKKKSTAAFSTSIENASELQIKYALLLNTEVESVENLALFSQIDDWYGTRYRLGGTTKNGIDCSAFTQILYEEVFGVRLPRTAKEQYSYLKNVSRTELKEGDLVFFNTTGGVSHVGIYLQNNKFAHASSSEGVTISDLYDSYWSRRFIGVGRPVSALNSTAAAKP